MLERYKQLKKLGRMKSRLAVRFIAHFQRVTDEEQALEFIQPSKEH